MTDTESTEEMHMTFSPKNSDERHNQFRDVVRPGLIIAIAGWFIVAAYVHHMGWPSDAWNDVAGCYWGLAAIILTLKSLRYNKSP